MLQYVGISNSESFSFFGAWQNPKSKGKRKQNKNRLVWI
jgi:hypothetical protein